MNNKLVSVKVAAKKIGVHHDTLLRYIRDGAPAKKIAVQGRKKVWMIDLAKLKRWIKNN